MKFVFFGNATAKNAAIRYRLLRFAAMLSAEGHTCKVCLPSSIDFYERFYYDKSVVSKLVYLLAVFLRRLFQLRHVPGADAILFRGPVFPYGPTMFEYLIHWMNPRMVFDIDDAVWERPAYVSSPFLQFQDFNWIWKMCRLCRNGIVGNAHLQKHLEKTGVKTVIIPTCIDVARHKQKQYVSRGPAGPVILGWTGLSDNLGYLDEIAPALRRLSQKYPILLYVASDRDYRATGIRIENQRWDLDHEIQYLQIPDIGLMPLAHTPRAEGKCGFKALEMMAVGTPCVISPVGMNREIVQEGVTGFFADSPEEWYEKLERLIKDPDLREKMGRAARAFVIEHYAHEVHFPNFKRALLNPP